MLATYISIIKANLWVAVPVFCVLGLAGTYVVEALHRVWKRH